MTDLPHCALLLKADARRLPLADESVGLVLADPPFNVSLRRGRWKDDLSRAEYAGFIRSFMAESFRVAKPYSALYCFCSDDPAKLHLFKACGLRAGWSWSGMLYWHRPNFGASGNIIRQPWKPSVEPILMFGKGGRPTMRNEIRGILTTNVLTYTAPQINFRRGRLHPCEKPPALYAHLLARTPGDPVLDLFCGSGASAEAAIRQSRPWIGVDIDYHEVSAKALRQMSLAGGFA